MRLLSRVVWTEGMHLAQHHFQAQSRYFEELVAFYVGQLSFAPHGVAGLELDAEALVNGTVSLIAGRGIMPDGLPFRFPDDPLPAALRIEDRFSPSRDAHVVLLAVPTYRPRQANLDAGEPEGAAATRFAAAARSIADETTGVDEKPVAVAKKNFRLALDVDPLEDHVTLPIARVRRDVGGRLVYDPEFVPPCVRIGASEVLMQRLSRMVEALDAKADSLAAQRDRGRAGPGDYAAREITEFWLSHALHSALPALRHALGTRAGHPETLYTELARLAGALCTFSLHSHPRELPAYDHDGLGECFAALDRHIRDHLEVVLPTRAIEVELRRASAAQLEATSALDRRGSQAYREFIVQSSPYFHLGTVDDRRAFDHAQWYLGVRSTTATGELIGRVPALVKVCSGKHIARLVKDAYPGLGLEHVARPPAQISPRSDTQYFRVQAAGACWTSIAETGEVGVYVPAAIREPELELAIVPATPAG